MSEIKKNASLDRRTFFAGSLGLAALGPWALAGCSNGGSAGASSGQTSGDTSGGSTSRSFVHPGLLHTEADFERMRTKVAAQAEPWLSGWNALLNTGRSHLNNSPRPLETVIRGGDGQNFAQFYIDVDRAYQLAVRWKVSGDTAYADKAVEFLNAWAYTMKYLNGNADRFLAAGIYGYQFANAGEIMRSYAGYAAADFAQFQSLLLNVFYPLNHSFLVNHNDAEITNYWANWDLCNIASVLAIGVLCDRVDLYDEAISYCKTGAGNGASSQAVYYVHPGYLGQWQESGRDQGHSTLGIGLAGPICEMAWNQGDDLYGYDNNRFLAGSEYVAKSNLTDASGQFYTVPFVPHINKQGTQTALSTYAQGHMRPVWEMIYNHYVNRKGLAAPYTALQAARLRPEYDGSNGDQPGIGTLTFTRDAIATGAKPSGLTAMPSGSQVILSWWGSAYATSYNVKRATRSGGPYATVASGITDLLTYSDSGLSSGTYYYVVTAQTPSGETGASNEARAITAATLHTRLLFDEGSGTTAADATGNAHTGTLTGATWVAGRNGSALSFDGVDDYVSLPEGIVKDLSDFTIMAWVYWNGSRAWERIFDFGSGTRQWMMLTPRNNGGVACFSITTNHGHNQQAIPSNAALPTGQWVHVAVTLSGSVGTLYVNGAAVGSNTEMNLAPFRLDGTTQNWLGRSQWSWDAYFNGRMDDFRIYHGALDAGVVALLGQA